MRKTAGDEPDKVEVVEEGELDENELEEGEVEEFVHRDLRLRLLCIQEASCSNPVIM